MRHSTLPHALQSNLATLERLNLEQLEFQKFKRGLDAKTRERERLEQEAKDIAFLRRLEKWEEIGNFLFHGMTLAIWICAASLVGRLWYVVSHS